MTKMKLTLSQHQNFPTVIERGKECQHSLKKTKAAKIRPESVAKEIKLGKRKEKIHAGKPENYSYDKADFKFITPLPIDAKISWRAMAIKFDVLNQEGIRPCNAGQVLLEAAKALGVKTDQFDTNVSVSGRDYMQRIRRPDTNSWTRQYPFRLLGLAYKTYQQRNWKTS